MATKGNFVKQIKVEKIVKKALKKNVLLSFCIVLCVLTAVLVCFFLSKKDLFAFSINPSLSEQTNVRLTEGEVYNEYSARLVFFGKDLSDKVNVKYYYRTTLLDEAVECDCIDTNKAGIYYAQYSTTVFPYSNVNLVREIVVIENNVID